MTIQRCTISYSLLVIIFYDDHIKNELSLPSFKKLITFTGDKFQPCLCFEIAGTKSNNSVTMSTQQAAMQKWQKWLQSLVKNLFSNWNVYMARIVKWILRRPNANKLFRSNCQFWRIKQKSNFQNGIWPQEGSITVCLQTILHAGTRYRSPFCILF